MYYYGFSISPRQSLLGYGEIAGSRAIELTRLDSGAVDCGLRAGAIDSCRSGTNELLRSSGNGGVTEVARRKCWGSRAKGFVRIAFTLLSSFWCVANVRLLAMCGSLLDCVC